MTAKDARLLKVTANALPRLLCFDKFKIFVVFLDYVLGFLSFFDFVMNTLGELRDYLFEDGFADNVPDFLQLRIQKYVFVLDSFQLIVKALETKFFEVEENVLNCGCEGLGVGQDCLD